MTALTTAQVVLLHNTKAIAAALEARDRHLAEVQPVDWSAATGWMVVSNGPSIHANVIPMWLASTFDGTVRSYTLVGPVDGFDPFTHIIRWFGGVEVYALARFVEPEAPAGLSAHTVDDDAAPESFETAALPPRPALYGIVEIKETETIGSLVTPDLEADEVLGHLESLAGGMTARGWEFEGSEDTGLEAPRDVSFAFSRPAAQSCTQPCCRGLRTETRFEVVAQ